MYAARSAASQPPELHRKSAQSRNCLSRIHPPTQAGCPIFATVSSSLRWVAKVGFLTRTRTVFLNLPKPPGCPILCSLTQRVGCMPLDQPPPNLLNFVENPSPTQLSFAQPSTRPRARQRSHNQRQRIPMRPKRRPLVPRHNRPRNTHNKTDKASDQGMPHRPIRSKPRRNIAAQNTKDNPIRRSQHQRPIAHRLPPRRKHAHRMQHHIGDRCQNNAHYNPGNHSRNTPARRTHNCLHTLAMVANTIQLATTHHNSIRYSNGCYSPRE
jgi:hypothetical protein